MTLRGRLDRMRIFGSLLFVLLHWAPLAPAQDEVIELYDDFTDGDLLDGNPVDWNGRMTRLATQRGGKRRISDGWLQVWNTGDWSVETTTADVFTGDVSVRTLVRTVGAPAPFLNVIAHGDASRESGNLGTLQDDRFDRWFPLGRVGNASIIRVDGVNNGQIRDHEVIEDFDATEEYIVQLDVVGDFVELRVWKPGEEFPEEPLLQVRETRYRSGEAGVGVWYPNYQRGNQNGVTHYMEFDYIWIRNRMLGRDDVPPPDRRSEMLFRRGDCNGDGTVNISDVTCTLNWLFSGEAEPGCLAAVNTNGDATTNLADPVSLLNFLFGGGPIITAPFPDCGPGTRPADEELGCANPPVCQ